MTLDRARMAAILRHNLAGSPGTEIFAELHDPRDLVVRGKKRYSAAIVDALGG